MLLPGGTENRSLEPSGENRREMGEYERGDVPPLIRGVWGAFPGKFFKIYVSENAFQAILKPIFAFSITSILSKVRHSLNTTCSETPINKFFYDQAQFFLVFRANSSHKQSIYRNYQF